MKIKSLIDIITNSSSECYQIKNTSGMTTEEFREKWFEELIRQGLFEKDGNCLDEFCKKQSPGHTSWIYLLRGRIYLFRLSGYV